MIRILSGVGLAVALSGVSPGGAPPLNQATTLPFSCELFAPTTSASALADRFGAMNIKTAQVPWGGAEGDLNEGTVLFDTTADARLEIYWRDNANRRYPEWVSVRGSQTRWRSPAGITLGTSLRTMERLNGRPFRLLGFGSDVSGTVMTWSGGRLDAQDTGGCRVRMRVAPEWGKLDGNRSGLVNRLKREPDYSSGHPAMQELDPTVYEIFLQYARVPSNQQPSRFAIPLDRAQQPPAEFRAGVELLTVDVQVTPAKGTPLRDLSAADFEVRISRVRRPVVSVTVLHDDDGPVTRSVSGGGDDTCVFGRRRKTDRPTVHYVIAVDRGAADRVEVSQVKVELTTQAFSIQGIAYRTPVRRGGRPQTGG